MTVSVAVAVTVCLTVRGGPEQDAEATKASAITQSIGSRARDMALPIVCCQSEMHRTLICMTTEAAETTDFRGKKMPSREGLGLAWGRYKDAVNRLSAAGLLPGVTQAAEKTSREIVLARAGFWLVWQLEGGFDGMRRLGMSEASIYRKVKAFRETFGAHPDEYVFPGVTVDVEAYLRATSSQTRE